MNFEGNLAVNLPVQPDKQEEVKKSDAERLRELQKIQHDRDLTEEEWNLVQELQNKASEIATGIKPLTELERNRFLELTKKQSNGDSDYDPEELRYLLDRKEGLI